VPDGPRPEREAVIGRRRGGSTGTVNRSGAAAGSVLYGVVENNHGLRLRVLLEQPRGLEGPVVGRFVLLAEGDNRHAADLRPLVDHETDAAEVLVALRLRSPKCVNVVNTIILAVEG
jgi:hypothetical protein